MFWNSLGNHFWLCWLGWLLCQDCLTWKIPRPRTSLLPWIRCSLGSLNTETEGVISLLSIFAFYPLIIWTVTHNLNIVLFSHSSKPILFWLRCSQFGQPTDRHWPWQRPRRGHPEQSLGNQWSTRHYKQNFLNKKLWSQPQRWFKAFKYDLKSNQRTQNFLQTNKRYHCSASSSWVAFY